MTTETMSNETMTKTTMTDETTTQTRRPGSEVLENLQAVRDAMSARRVFGDAIVLDDMTVIPVAKVSGGGGGGAGEGKDAAESGFGAGFGLGVRPMGVYEIHDGHAEFKPSLDVNRVVKGGQVLVGIVAVCVTLVLLRRQSCC